LLRNSIDPDFQAAFEQTLEKQFGEGIWDLVKAKKVGIVLADITDTKKPKVAEVNGDVMLYAASLPKIAIVLGVFVEMERGNLKMDDETRQLLITTVRKSSNKAATELLERVGIENLAEILQSDRYRLYDPDNGGGLWVGRDYGGGPVWKRDPVNNISMGLRPCRRPAITIWVLPVGWWQPSIRRIWWKYLKLLTSTIQFLKPRFSIMSMKQFLPNASNSKRILIN
jgi:beta-lactamase class A